MGIIGERNGWLVYGPYTRKDNRKVVVLYEKDKSIPRHTSISYAKYLLEIKIGRLLEPHETADHIDEDKTNDDPANLQILSLVENVRKHAASKECITTYEFICPVCKNTAVKLIRYVKHNKKRGSKGPYCSRSCAGKASHT